MTTESMTVLLVDDEPDFLSVVARRLERREMKVHSVGSGEEALALLETHPVDAVVLDVKMPGMDGIETLKRIKAAHPEVEVIMLTGHADLEVAISGMALGAFDYLLKPADIDELMFKLRDASRTRPRV
ncbi:sigma-54-dependent transcriptional regulator [Desulfovibrio subterraneus]|jgi:DNA-binding NtrC family response regulator|uniref:Response regulator n=1 Tax=Desulfovibrio subterraneus TaxID=2718620 RepID=A0A7J0BG06_9BACT|nr:response regulator [Desulfovibrio subterraneus]GFM32630.1 response regulator [Desulfovibrio subterraneus]